ncbi:hypothetical protein [Sphingobacterium sp. HSC-15S19]|uniref:hypothetical protein n=1 Tax=Sphingobacterium sp. HSC-15S19 TaxID=2910971 RepID=UPI003D19F0E8
MKKRINVILGCFGFVAILACSGNEGTKVKKEDRAEQPSVAEPAAMLDYKTAGSKGVGTITSFEHKPFDAQLANRGVELFVSKCECAIVLTAH